MNYEYINEQEEEEAVRDVMHLHWWLNEEVHKDKKYFGYIQPKLHVKSYINYVFKPDNSILTTCDGWKRFYALTEDNKLLKCTFFKKREFSESTYTYYGITFELYGDASSLVITKREESKEYKCPFQSKIKNECEYIQISDNSGRSITHNEEVRIDRQGQMELPDSIRLVDILKPITVDDIYQAFKDAREKSNYLLAQKAKDTKRRKK